METINLQPGNEVCFEGNFYIVAEVKVFPHGKMVGIYNEPQNKHIRYIDPKDIFIVIPCYACQGGGCPVCSGQGKIIY